MFAIIKNNQIHMWPVHNLSDYWPNTSFPHPITANSLPAGVVKVVVQPQPKYDPMTQMLEINDPVLIDGQWQQVWAVHELTQEQKQQKIQDHNNIQRQLRADQYREVTDALFFKQQRGEVLPGTWESAVNEIRAKYPTL
jgi:hypothetical protein